MPAASPASLSIFTCHQAKDALARGVAYLLAAQEPDGSWWDFWLPIGASDAWVTAYTALALLDAAAGPHLPAAARTRARQAAAQAAAWLLRQFTPARPGWGYNATTPVDADSTAHVISLLARLGLEVPAAALATLRRAAAAGAGYRTYQHAGNWSAPAADISAAALRALHDAGELDAAALCAEWQTLLGPHQAADGWWQGYWWLSSAYTTGLVLDLWARAGRPALTQPVTPAWPRGNAFDLAWSVRIAHRLGWEMAEPLAALLRLQAHDGGWPAAAILRVPPERADAPSVTLHARDARRLFVTATAVAALSRIDDLGGRRPNHPPRSAVGQHTDALLAAATPGAEAHRLSNDARSSGLGAEKTRSRVAATPARRLYRRASVGQHTDALLAAATPGAEAHRLSNDARSSGLGAEKTRSRVAATPARRLYRRASVAQHTDALLAAIAERLGFAPADAAAGAAAWAALTADSFADPAPWPAEQLSALSGGVPLEFSATVGPGAPPALRTAVEVGNPYLPPYRRARAGVDAVARTAAQLGYDASWQRIRPAVDVLVRPQLDDPAARRFWVWGGLDHAALPSAPPALKIYLNLLHTVDGGAGAQTARQRLEQALAAAALPLNTATRAALDALDAVGFLHEAGFGFTRDKLACKVYYELHGWRPALVQQVLALAGLAQQPVDALCTAIPGLLPVSLAAKQRAGIALRIHPVSGEITEVTTAMAYPPALLSPAETLRRTHAWLLTLGGSPLSYDAVAATLLPGWAAQPLGRLHSLFTRSVSAEKQWTTIYLRPNLEDIV